jgi:hypothetical protein
MSDPKAQRADGCSVCFSLLLGALFVLAFFFFEKIFRVEDTNEPDTYISSERKEEIDKYKLESATFIEKVDSFHIENNTSLESFMQNTINIYQTSSENSK